jgi:hypothetical protein
VKCPGNCNWKQTVFVFSHLTGAHRVAVFAHRVHGRAFGSGRWGNICATLAMTECNVSGICVYMAFDVLLLPLESPPDIPCTLKGDALLKW